MNCFFRGDEIWLIHSSNSKFDYGEETSQILRGSYQIFISASTPSNSFDSVTSVKIGTNRCLKTGRCIYWFGIQGQSGGGVPAGGGERWRMAAGGGAWVQHLRDLLLDSHLRLSWSFLGVPPPLVHPCRWGSYLRFRLLFYFLIRLFLKFLT